MGALRLLFRYQTKEPGGSGSYFLFFDGVVLFGARLFFALDEELLGGAVELFRPFGGGTLLVGEPRRVRPSELLPRQKVEVRVQEDGEVLEQEEGGKEEGRSLLAPRKDGVGVAVDIHRQGVV